MKRVLGLALLTACLTPIACATPGSTAGGVAGATAPGRQQTTPQAPATMHELPATAGPGFTVADVRFMQNMIGHHAQALVMAAMVPTHGAGSQLRRLAEKIDISQRDEIDLMTRWLTAREQVVPAAHHLHAMRMPGMLSAEQMARLGDARGREFERLFLSFMIQHHRGALQMVETLLDHPGAAQDPDIFRFITDVDADQRAEIFTMQSMLNMLAAAPGSRSR